MNKWRGKRWGEVLIKTKGGAPNDSFLGNIWCLQKQKLSRIFYSWGRLKISRWPFHSCGTFEIIGWLIAKFFPIWSTVAGYSNSHCQQQQQSYSGLCSPGRSNSTYFWEAGYFAINEWGWVGYEELGRSKRVLSTQVKGEGGQHPPRSA